MRNTGAVVLALAAAAACKSDEPAPKAATVGIEYIAHASFRIHTEAGATLLIDPYASRVWLGYDFPDQLLDADAVVITHPHYDHDYGEFIGRAVPWTEADTVLRDPGTFEVADAVLTGVAGKHADPYGQEFGQKNTV
jgi:L-ascorbate metabolism protein UlaG (beta-lactamase superfamily)